ncbi:MAG: hypothetical protein JWL86_3526, partial [Rhizobium sp.]|nr:hypothetical protein [Rhizobium sp.]
EEAAAADVFDGALGFEGVGFFLREKRDGDVGAFAGWLSRYRYCRR